MYILDRGFIHLFNSQSTPMTLQHICRLHFQVEVMSIDTYGLHLQYYFHQPLKNPQRSKICQILHSHPALYAPSTTMPSSGLSNIVLRRLHRELDRHNAAAAESANGRRAQLLATAGLPLPRCHACGFRSGHADTICPGCGVERTAGNTSNYTAAREGRERQSSSTRRRRSSSPLLPRVRPAMPTRLSVSPTAVEGRTARVSATPQRAPPWSQAMSPSSPLQSSQNDAEGIASDPAISSNQLDRIEQDYHAAGSDQDRSVPASATSSEFSDFESILDSGTPDPSSSLQPFDGLTWQSPTPGSRRSPFQSTPVGGFTLTTSRNARLLDSPDLAPLTHVPSSAPLTSRASPAPEEEAASNRRSA